MVIKFTNYDESYCNFSWKWLNDYEVKKLTMVPYFTKKSQYDWFCSLKRRSDYFIWGIECNNKPIGALGIKNVDYINKSGEYFGYIGEKEYWSRGIGKSMMKFIIKKALERNLDMLYLKVLKSNKRAIKLYLKNKFITYEDTNKLLKMSREVSAEIV